MIRYVMKNYIKLMCRSSMNIILIVVAPIILIAVLSSAFSSLMASYEEAESFGAGYRVLEENMMTPYIDALKEACEENDISLVEYPEGDVEDVMRSNGLAGFVEFNEDSYTIYKSSEHETEGQILEYMMSSFERNIEIGMTGAVTGQQIPETELNIAEHDFMPAVDATDYYGIVEVVYFLWCGIVCVAGIVNNEKKFKIIQKLRVAGLSETKIYLSKFIPTAAVVSLGILIAAVTSSLLFGIHWGSIPLSVLIVFLSVTAAVSLGLMFYNIFDNIVATIMVTFAIVWIWGFYGGSFETYLFSSHPEFIKELSPIYYCNRALIELSVQGSSDYAVKGIAIFTVMTLVTSAIAILAGRLRKRGSAC